VTHYDVLGVAPSAPVAEVRRAYLALARQHHPDRPGGDAATMRAVNEAWTVLGDPGRRASYDRSLRPAVSAPPAAPAAERVRTDDEELLADLADDTPLGGRIVLPRWLSLLPVAVFAVSVSTFVMGVMFSAAPALAVGFALFVLSCALFLAAPFVALLSSRRGNR
jgi:hypothetical protein